MAKFRGKDVLFSPKITIKGNNQIYYKKLVFSEDTHTLNLTNLPFEPDFVCIVNLDNTSAALSIRNLLIDINAYKDTSKPPFILATVVDDSGVMQATQSNTSGFKSGGLSITQNSILINFSLARSSALSNKFLRSALNYDLYVIKVKNNENYFNVDNGVLSLKPEYRGKGLAAFSYSISDNGEGNDGSKINELPEELYLPETINGINITSYADAMFMGNERVKKIHLLKAISVIPDYFCRKAANLENVFNTENLTQIGNSAFQFTSLNDIYIPKITSLSDNAFNSAQKLKTVVISDTITSIPNSCFSVCTSLNALIGGNSVTSVGNLAFWKTYNLKNVKGVINGIIEGGENSSIGSKCFIHSRINADWQAIENSDCQVVNTSTPLQYNAAYDLFVNYQNNNTFTPKIKRLGNTFNQSNNDFKDVVIGATINSPSNNKVYGKGCVLLACMHAYCGIKGYTNLQTPMQVEQQMLLDAIAIGKETEFRNAIQNYYYDHTKGIDILNTLGISSTTYNTSNLNNYVEGLYTEIQKENTYIIINVDASGSGGHEYMVYGVNSSGELFIADSETPLGQILNTKEATLAKMLPQSFATRTFTVVSQ